MENINNIYESVADWWADKIRGIHTSKVNEKDIRIFKDSLAILIHDNLALNGSITISLTTHNILTKSLIKANILSNDFCQSLKDEMKITPHLITVYDRYGHLQGYLSI